MKAIAPIILLPLLPWIAFAGCASHPTKDKIVTVDMVVFSWVPSPEGGLYKTTIRRVPTRAYLSQDIERSPNTKSVMRITNNEKDQGIMVGPPVTSPVDDKILFWVMEYGKDQSLFSNIWQQDYRSRTRTRVTSGRWFDNTPSYSPDGKYIYFSSNRTSLSAKLWRVKTTGGGGITKITQTESMDQGPSVSPDGANIVYSSLPIHSKKWQVWVVEASSGLPTVLREGESPKTSPDGKKILFLRKDRRSGKRQLWMMNEDGSHETQLTQNTKFEIKDPNWSPDGKSIVYASDEGFDANGLQNFDLWLMKVDGNNPTQLTTNGSWDDSPVFDRDGKAIFFRSNREGVFNIWRLELNPSEPAPSSAASRQ